MKRDHFAISVGNTLQCQPIQFRKRSYKILMKFDNVDIFINDLYDTGIQYP